MNHQAHHDTRSRADDITPPPGPACLPKTNRLAGQKSPYLLQHQHNPVDWFPWGEEAFAGARAEQKPIFLSIGYSTCHWCHVMERESFENETVARFLNEHFISLKVDREERPDVDRIYMTFVQAMTGQGGWPLTCFLTPDLEPFYGGTYYPPENRHGRPGLLTVLEQVRQAWAGRRHELLESARQMHDRLSQALAHEATPGMALNDRLLRQAGEEFKKLYDPVQGGFSPAPKFPQPSLPAFLLRHGQRHGDPEAIDMVLHTCERMADGGICDHLGGGFARYSVDEQWLVPHFEKMLYDNAQLTQLYLDTFLISGRERFASVARDICRYVLRDMTHPEGGFFSAEDADSEGKEGRFYCWTRAELALLLSPEEFTVATRYFGITEEGNFLDHSDPAPLRGQNVLSIVHPELAQEDQPRLQSAREKMFRARCQRVRPHLDDKILSSWNGLMLGALARAAVVLNDDSFRRAAEMNLAFLKHRLWDAQTGTLYHRWRDGERDTVQLLEAYASLLAGVLDLYEATLEPAHLELAVALADTLLRKFHDPEQGGFWQSAGHPRDLILRVKEDYDGALPSGNSLATLALLKLAAITERPGLKPAAEQTLRLLAERLQRLPQAVPHLLLALDFWLEEPSRVVIAGPVDNPATRRLLQAVHSVYRPNTVVLGTRGPVFPFAATLPPQGGQPTAYLCTGASCQPPVTTPQDLRSLLGKAGRILA
jgi:uncharacterized protein